MIDNQCLLLKPRVSTADGRERQESNIDNVIRLAIDQADLVVEGEAGIEVVDITLELIQKIDEATVVVVDAQSYEQTGAFTLSPFLFYLLAIAHTLGNKTILVAPTTTHLPHSLLREHTLTYSGDNLRGFIRRFKEIVVEIQNKQNFRPDNPYQEFLREKLVKEEQARARMAEEELRKLREEVAKQKPPSQIKFTPVRS